MRHLKTLMADNRAATAVEYGLILACIVIAMMVALVNLASTTIGMWNRVGNEVTNAG